MTHHYDAMGEVMENLKHEFMTDLKTKNEIGLQNVT